MAEAKMPILNMQFTKVSLEDIFLELTQNETAPVPDEQDTKPESAPEDETGTDTEKRMKQNRRLMMKAIYKKEVKSYLTSMIGYVFIFSFCFWKASILLPITCRMPTRYLEPH